MLNRREKDFKGALKDIFNTESGKKVLKYLKEDFVDVSAVRSSVEETYYTLGQKEFVQNLLTSLNSEDDLNSINTYNIGDE